MSEEKSLELRSQCGRGVSSSQCSDGVIERRSARRVRNRAPARGISRVFFSHREAPQEKVLCSSGSHGRLQRPCAATGQHGPSNGAIGFIISTILKFARFKEIFPGAAKSDRIDARKGLELFQLSDHLPLAKEVLQEVSGTPPENEVLKRFTRRRRRLVNERVRVVNNLQADLQAVCPGLLEITGEASNQWFLNFLLSVDTLPQLARLRRSTLLKIPSVGVKSAAIIERLAEACPF